jgi:hypothetical protein
MVNNGFKLFAHLAAPDPYRLLENLRQASCVLCDQPTRGTRLTQLYTLPCAIFFYGSLLPFDRSYLDAALSLITSQGPSSHPIELQFVCDDCNASLPLQDFNVHLVSRHAYEIICSYCDDFRFNLRDIQRFQEHLRRNHREVARNDELISQSHSTLTLLQRDTLAHRHSSLRKKRRSLLRPFR